MELGQWERSSALETNWNCPIMLGCSKYNIFTDTHTLYSNLIYLDSIAIRSHTHNAQTPNTKHIKRVTRVRFHAHYNVTSHIILHECPYTPNIVNVYTHTRKRWHYYRSASIAFHIYRFNLTRTHAHTPSDNAHCIYGYIQKVHSTVHAYALCVHAIAREQIAHDSLYRKL